MNLTNIIDKNMNIYNDKSMVLSRFIIEFVFTEEVYLFYVSDFYIFFRYIWSNLKILTF
jgi:hypothetical protein